VHSRAFCLFRRMLFCFDKPRDVKKKEIEMRQNANQKLNIKMKSLTIAVLLILTLFSFAGCGENGGDVKDTGKPGASVENTCTIQINCSLLVGKDLNGTGLQTLVPESGVILDTTEVTINPGDTVYDVTLRVAKDQKIHMASEGSIAMGNLYVAAISNIYEKAYNSKSGWVYLVNDAQPGIGSGMKELKAGDKLVWAYSLDLGNDL